MSEVSGEKVDQGVNAAQPYIWLTGASSGIGLALAEKLFAHGYSLVLSARNEEALQTLKQKLLASQPNGSQRVEVFALDVSDVNDIDAAREQLRALAPNLSAMYLCAGLCQYLDLNGADLADADWSMMKRVAEVNYFGAVNCVAIALPLLKRAATETQPAHIVGLASQAMLMPFTRAEAYGSSKAALHYFLQSLGMDLKPHHIDVTSVLPGFVETPMTQQNNFSMPFIMSAEEAAERIFNGVQKRPRVFAFPKRLYFLLKFFSMVPGLWFRKMSPSPESLPRQSEEGEK